MFASWSLDLTCSNSQRLYSTQKTWVCNSKRLITIWRCIKKQDFHWRSRCHSGLTIASGLGISIIAWTCRQRSYPPWLWASAMWLSHRRPGVEWLSGTTTRKRDMTRHDIQYTQVYYWILLRYLAYVIFVSLEDLSLIEEYWGLKCFLFLHRIAWPLRPRHGLMISWTCVIWSRTSSIRQALAKNAYICIGSESVCWIWRSQKKTAPFSMRSS